MRVLGLSWCVFQRVVNGGGFGSGAEDGGRKERKRKRKWGVDAGADVPLHMFSSHPIWQLCGGSSGPTRRRRTRRSGFSEEKSAGLVMMVSNNPRMPWC